MEGFEKVEIKWNAGFPPFPWCDEPFYAKLKDGQLLEIRQLPEEWAYDWESNDELNTYYADYRIKELVEFWAQKSDSQYVEFNIEKE